MAALLVRRRRDARSSRGFAARPRPGSCTNQVSPGPALITGKRRDLSACGAGPSCNAGARARTVPRKPLRLRRPESDEARTLLACHTRTPSRLRLGESRLEVSLLPRLPGSSVVPVTSGLPCRIAHVPVRMLMRWHACSPGLLRAARGFVRPAALPLRRARSPIRNAYYSGRLLPNAARRTSDSVAGLGAEHAGLRPDLKSSLRCLGVLTLSLRTFLNVSETSSSRSTISAERAPQCHVVQRDRAFGSGAALAGGDHCDVRRRVTVPGR